MIHLPPLITDLGFILVIAALSTLLFKKMGQPLVLGYLIAGFLVSPHVPFFPTVVDRESIKVWSEIGVIFLLFGLGLEFSFKKLFKVGGSAGFTAVFEIVFMLGLGFLVGHVLGWSNIDSLFFGAILSMSSTTIIVRAFQELGMRNHKYVDLVFGILIVEDIVAIFLLVMLTALSGAAVVSGFELVASGLRLLFFVALWFAVGIFLIPIFLRKIRHLLEDETMLLVAIGLCFVMVIIAAGVGFSPALGAFVMGSLLAETPEGHKMESLMQSVKNLFAAIFFVSVGMMIDPKLLWDRWDLVLIATGVTIVGKFLSTFLGALLSGQSRKKSFQAGMSLAQIGEFSFIIASLGVSLKVTSDFLYPLAIAVSAVTTFTTPYLIKIAEPVYWRIESLLPQSFKTQMDRYHSSFNSTGKIPLRTLLLKTYGIKVILNTVIVVGIIWASKALLAGKLQHFVAQSSWAGSISLLLCLMLAGPFLWGIVFGGPSLSAQREFEELQKLKGLQIGLFFGRFMIGIILVSAILSQFLTLEVASGFVIVVVLLLIFLSPVLMKNIYQKIETDFLKNLTEKERLELVKAEGNVQLLPWEATLGTYEVDTSSKLVGKSLQDLSFKKTYGLTVAAVFRGAQRIFAPGGSLIIWPFDKLICFGSEEDLQDFYQLLEKEKNLNLQRFNQATQEEEYSLKSLLVSANSPVVNKSISESRIREIVEGGIVIGIERGQEKILGPRPQFQILENDLLWIISDQSQVKEKKV